MKRTLIQIAAIAFGILSYNLADANEPTAPNDKSAPNVLFISVDDLNDWIGCMQGHPQAKTPNMDRLAGSGMLFTNAHCPAPSCNPSRTAIMTGISPHKSGVYDNRQSMRKVLPDAELIPAYFSRNGYWSAGSGKILHYFTDAQSWDQYHPPKETEDPFPRMLYPDPRPLSLPRAGSWQYIETDWGPLDVSDEEFGGDWLVSQWVGEQLKKKHDKPFFMACGIYRPHEPWFVPKKYFDLFPLADIQLPPGYRENDLDDLPSEAQRRGKNRYFEHIQKNGQWKKGIQGYLASIAFADAMIGNVLDALDNGPNADNTIVVLWSDHGWHLGEKQHWQKYTAWRASTRVPLMIRAPKNTPALPSGTTAGSVCDQPVNLLSLFPTLAQLAGLPAKKSNDAPSLVPLLKEPAADWPHVSVTFLDRPKNYGISGKRYRYIEYANGQRELYDTQADPYEWENLAERKEHGALIEKMRSHAPTDYAPYVSSTVTSLPKLEWKSAKSHTSTPPQQTGTPLEVMITNGRIRPIKIFGLSVDGKKNSFGTLQAAWRKPFKATTGAVFLVTDDQENPLGHFVVGDEPSHAIVPADTIAPDAKP